MFWLLPLERAAGSGTEEPSLDCSLSQQKFREKAIAVAPELPNDTNPPRIA